MQYTQIDRAEVARCTLSVSCSTDLNYSVVFVDRVGVFLEHVQFNSVQSLDRLGRRDDTRGDSAEILFHFFSTGGPLSAALA